MMTEPFDRSRLSSRENSILEGAIEGLTDIQIALRMEISQSTVNSYWVRIRGKLGQLSRTELVALALKRDAEMEREVANAQLAELREAAQLHSRISADYARSEILRAALDALPEAVFVCCHEGLIRYVNPRLETMFGYGGDELIDQPAARLLSRVTGENEVRTFLACLKDPQRTRLGIGNVFYGLRKDGESIRIVLLLDGASTSTGPVTTCVVRDFMGEISTRREFLAVKPTVRRSGWE